MLRTPGDPGRVHRRVLEHPQLVAAQFLSGPPPVVPNRCVPTVKMLFVMESPVIRGSTRGPPPCCASMAA